MRKKVAIVCESTCKTCKKTFTCIRYSRAPEYCTPECRRSAKRERCADSARKASTRSTTKRRGGLIPYAGKDWGNDV